jgi:hypothetical protein
MSAERRFLQDDEARALQAAHDTLGGDSGHVLVGLVNTLATLDAEGKGDCIGEIARVCGGVSLSDESGIGGRSRPMRTK